MHSKSWAIGIDIGGTKIDIAHVDLSGKIQKRIILPSDVKGGPKAIENDIVKAIHLLIEEAQISPIGIGAGIPGQVEAKTGYVHFAPNLKWHAVPFQDNLQRAVDLPVIVTNDVRAATWGEWHFGAGKDCMDFICLFFGSGIGGGIVSGGHLLKGASNSAGEFGHMTLDIQGPLCTCGNRGCFEALAGGWAIAKRTREAIIKDASAGDALLKRIGGKLENLTTHEIIEAYYAKDPLAVQIIADITQVLIAGSIGIVNVLNPKRLILGGGVLFAIPELVQQIDEGIREKALKSASTALEIMPAYLQKNAGVIGCAALVLCNKVSKC